ncbi:hypothetical protein [Virgibacillus sp. 6R]|nr:hypothetical protein [Virgibacillus sp. 6R]
MVARHLHLFKVDYKEKQKVCQNVEIDYKAQVKLAVNNKQLELHK